MYMNQKLVPNWFKTHPRTCALGSSAEGNEGMVGGIVPSLAPMKSVDPEDLVTESPSKRPRTTSPPNGPQAPVMVSFLHSLEKLVQDTNYTPNWHRVNSSHPMLQHLLRTVSNGAMSKPTSLGVKRQDLEEVSKSYEESMLRPPMSTERACCEQSECEGVLMAREDPCEDTSKGFVCVEFRTPRCVERGERSTTGMCLLCLRKQTMLRYYNSVANQCDTVVVSQPHRNIVGKVGEYAKEVCIQSREGKFDGIVSPFVKHERHHYVYSEGIIRQTSHVNFRQASRMLDTG